VRLQVNVIVGEQVFPGEPFEIPAEALAALRGQMGPGVLPAGVAANSAAFSLRRCQGVWQVVFEGVWVGVGLFVFGLASLVWPPLKVVIGSVTTSAALTLGGLALMVLPSLIVGNELLILGGVVVAVGGWFLAHRHGQLRGLVAASPGNPPAGTGDSRS
jgi:hypothetical protein